MYFRWGIVKRLEKSYMVYLPAILQKVIQVIRIYLTG